MGARAGDELSSGDRRRQPDDGSRDGHLSGEHGAVFVGRRRSAERIFLLVTARSRRLLRGVPERRFIFVLRVLRAGHRAEILSHRYLRLDQQGIRRNEVDAVLLFWRHVCVRGDSRRLRNCWLAGSGSAVGIPVPAASADVGISCVVSRICRARRHLAAAHVGAHWPRRCAYSRLDVARGHRHETRLLRRAPRGDEPFPAGISDVEQMDRRSGGDWDYLCRGGGASPR